MSASSAQTQLARAHALQQNGRLPEAAAIVRELLNLQPRNAQALHQMGVILAQMRVPQDAVVCLATAVEVEPDNAAMRFNLANALVALGHFDRALPHFERTVALAPKFVPGLRGLAQALLRTGRADIALSSLLQAVRLAPADPHLHNDVGIVLEKLGRADEALRYFERATQLEPSYLEAHRNTAVTAMSLQRYGEALRSIERAISLDATLHSLHSARGHALLALGRFAEAAASYDRAVALHSYDPVTFRNRGAALMELGRGGEALVNIDRALQLAPGEPLAHGLRGKLLLRGGRPLDALPSFATLTRLMPESFEAHFGLGTALATLDRHRESLASFDRAIELNGGSAEAWNNRGVELEQLLQPQDALSSFQRALACNPGHFDALINAGNVHKRLGRFQEALQNFDAALAIVPDDPNARWSKGLLQLTVGEFASGLPLYEARFQLPHVRRALEIPDAPRWTGAESLTGKTLLVMAEQGLGDAVQFCRYLGVVEERGAHVLLETPAALTNLFGSLEMRGQCIVRGEPRPSFDMYCPLLSLPLALGTTLESIPARVPYLAAPAADVMAWRRQLTPLPGRKIALSWQGNVDTERQPWVRGRSFPLAAVTPLMELPDLTWIAVQRGAGSEQRSEVEFGERLLQLVDPGDMSAAGVMETAALVSALDLVITSDSFVAHLCGALGVPVWVAVHFVPDWRWLLERADSPWYPTMRLFRQQAAGVWQDVFERIAAELRHAPPAARRFDD